MSAYDVVVVSGEFRTVVAEALTFPIALSAAAESFKLRQSSPGHVDIVDRALRKAVGGIREDGVAWGPPVTATRGPTLHDMAEQYRKLLDAALSEVDPETGEMADAFDAALRAIEDSIERKVDGYAYVREALEAWAGRLTKDATRLVKRAKTVAGRIERMENELRDAFVLGKLSRVDGERCSVTVKAPASAVDVFAAALIPPELMRTPDPPAPEPNKVEIAKRLKAGQEVPGARMKEGRRAVLWA